MRTIAAAASLAALFLAMPVGTAFAQKLPLYELVQTGTPEQVQKAIAAGAKVNDIANPPINDSLLTISIQNKDPRVMAVLLKAGADPDWKGIPGKIMIRTPLGVAARNPDPAYVKLLIDAGAKVDCLDGLMFMPIDDAALNSNPAVAALLFKAGARASPHKTLGHFVPIQPVCIAVAGNPNIEVLKLLLHNGGDPSAIGCIGDPYGTPLHFAVEYARSADVFALLIEAGADAKAGASDGVNTPQPPIFELATTARADIVPLYAKAGADLNAALPRSMTTPLMTAAMNSPAPEMIAALIDAGSRVNDVDATGTTALMLAAAQGKEPKIIDALLARGADPKLKNRDNKSAYDYAKLREGLKGSPELAALDVKGAVSLIELAKAGSAKAVQTAIRDGAAVNDRDLNGQTPLGIAVRYNPDSAVAASLLAAGALPNDPDGLGRTPLMIAAESNPDPAVITMLIKAGADPAARTPDMFKLSALMIAAQSNPEPRVITALAACGAAGGSVLDAVDVLGRSALIMAADQNPNPEVLGALLGAGADPGIVDMTRRTALDYAKEKPAFKGSPQLAALAAATK